MRALVSLPFLVLFGLAAWQQSAAPRIELELVYLANEGFLARAGETSLVIDAFVTSPYGGYAAVPPELFADMLAGKAPFEDVELALASHAHRDHFQPGPAAEFLRARAGTRFLSSPQVVDELVAELDDHAAVERLDALLPEARAALAWETEGVRVELLRLPHAGGARNAGVQNLGHLIELGGARLLHVGDADLVAEDLAAYGLAERGIDIALLPYWWFGDAESLATIRKTTSARHLVAIHVPPSEVAEVRKRLDALDPALVLFEQPAARRTFALERER